MLDKNIIRRHFDNSAEGYDLACVLQDEIAKRLTERLDYIKIQPSKVLDLGSGTGKLSKGLLKRYPKARVIALDLAFEMAKKSKKQGRWLRKPQAVCADAEQLPIKSGSVELLISNLMLHWCNDLANTFVGFHRVLAPNGLLLFTLFGPDTLQELRQSWGDVDNTAHTSDFPDMHEVGDALLQAGFINPVMDMEVITMTYKNVEQLMHDIKMTGSNNSHCERDKGLMGKQKFKAFKQAYEQFKTDDGYYPATWEVVYGHAWVGEGMKLTNFDKVIPIKSI